MKTETIEKILNFLEEKEGKEKPRKWFKLIEKLKLIKEFENHPDGTQYRYNGRLDLSYSKITKLPDDLYVNGSLILIDCKQLTELPIKLHVDGYLGLRGCKQLTKLPDNLYVRDYLSVRETNIEDIPNNLYVGGDFNVGDTPLADNYTDKEIYEMIKLRGGEVEVAGIIFRD